MFIEPKLNDAYLWLPDDSPDHLDIIVAFPEEFDQSKLVIKLDNNNTEAYVGIETMPPIFCGCLFEEATKIEKLPGEAGTTIFRITKKAEGDWKYAIKAPTEQDGLIDPRSSFTLSQTFFVAAQDEELPDDKRAAIVELALGYLKIAVACRYSDALVYAAQMSMQEGSEDQVAILLGMAANDYGNAHAHFLLGLILTQNEKTVPDSIPHFEAALAGGIADAINALGEIYSPEQVPHYEHEDAEKAFHCFEEMLKLNPEHSYAMMNIAKLYAVGKGCEKDIEKAKQLRDKAKELNPELDSFEIKEDGSIWHIAAAATAVAAAAGIAAINIMKKK